jgi:hypothetical protein
MKNLAVLTILFLASLAIGATPILIGVALVYAVAWFLSRSEWLCAPLGARAGGRDLCRFYSRRNLQN